MAMVQFELNAGFLILLIAGFWSASWICRYLKGENKAMLDVNRQLTGSNLLPGSAAAVRRQSWLRFHPLRQPAWRAAVAVSGFTLIFGIPASPEAHECPLRPLRFQQVLEEAGEPEPESTAPCALVSLRYARQLAEQNADRVQLNPALILAVIYHESRFAPCAVSRSGAQGLMQLSPGTARELGVANPFDPSENVEGGTRYLGYLLDRYDGDTALALAAYKVGMRRIDGRRGRPASLATQQYVDNIRQLADELSND